MEPTSLERRPFVGESGVLIQFAIVNGKTVEEICDVRVLDIRAQGDLIRINVTFGPRDGTFLHVGRAMGRKTKACADNAPANYATEKVCCYTSCPGGTLRINLSIVDDIRH